MHFKLDRRKFAAALLACPSAAFSQPQDSHLIDCSVDGVSVTFFASTHIPVELASEDTQRILGRLLKARFLALENVDEVLASNRKAQLRTLYAGPTRDDMSEAARQGFDWLKRATQGLSTLDDLPETLFLLSLQAQMQPRAPDARTRSGLPLEQLIRAVGLKKPSGIQEVEGAVAQAQFFSNISTSETEVLIEQTRGLVGNEPKLQRRRELSHQMLDLYAKCEFSQMLAVEHRIRVEVLGWPQSLFDRFIVLRNRQFARRVRELVSEGEADFIALGAAHLVGSEGVPSILSRKD